MGFSEGGLRGEEWGGGTILQGGFASLQRKLEGGFGGAFRLSWLLVHQVQARGTVVGWVKLLGTLN